MTGTKRLAAALCAASGMDPEGVPFPMEMTRYWRDAQALLADPAPLLTALAEAGVLREKKCGHHDQCVTCRNLEPMTRSEGRHKACHRRYVTEWRPADA